MERALRNQLYVTVVRCRQLLEQDLAQQLEGRFGVHADGSLEPLPGLTHLDAPGRADRGAVEAAIHHYEAGGMEHPAAVERYLRESAFTFLNRLVALKLMEHPARALIQPSIGGAQRARGFGQFCRVSPEAVRAEADGGYQLYLELLFDDLAWALGALFDRSLPASIPFPNPACLGQLLAVLDDPALEPAWAEDETIGWVYQYFTPSELREEARKASSAPRSSYELAFRNQFYTPHYVVAFLADNTLGRLWVEQRRGDTQLAAQCEFLVRNTDAGHAGQTRRKRDPRTLRILDPACGSGHFLLYCFDLLSTIYAEAYDDPELGAALRADYPDRAGFLRAVPGLILEHNLHGVDIDRRACQLAGFALWLRAQRAWAGLGLKFRQRPPVAGVHIVCAEPMPGEYDLLGEFVRDLRPPVLGNMLCEIWDHMQLAGQAGTLLQIEGEIGETVRRSRRALAALPPGIQLTLFGPAQPQQLPLHLDPRDLDDDVFWAEAEARVLEALHRYASLAAGDRGVVCRLFADDARQGMAFVDLLRQPFDVVLMNPPFGAASLGSKAYLESAYPRTKNDLYAAFVERGLQLLRPGGMLGAITSRTGFFLTSFQPWREEILLKEARLIALADLGYGVLDTAMVETAAYVLRKG